MSRLIVQYLYSLAAVAAALLARWLLNPMLGDRLPFIMVFAVLMPLVLLVRPGAFLAAATLGLVGTWYLFFLPAQGSFRLEVPPVWLQVALFGLAVAAAAITAWLWQRATKRTQSAEAMVRGFVDESPTGNWVTNAQGRIIYANRAMAKAIGRPVEQILGRTHAQVLPPKLAAVAIEQIAAVRQTGQVQTSVDAIELADGYPTARVMEWRRFPITLGGHTHFVAGMANDVTERARAERALRESEERFRLLVEGVRDYAIFMLDSEGHVISWNAGAERIKGYTAPEILGQHFSRFYSVEAVEKGWPQHGLDAAKAEGRWEDEGWRVRKDGSRFWANVVITAVRDEAGRLKGFSKITRDLTARKLAEEALREGEARERAHAAELKAIMDATPALIWIARDPQCRVITGNRASFEFLRMPPGANPSLSAPEGERLMHFRVLVNERVLSPEELPLQRAVRGEEVRNLEQQFRFEDGTSHYLLGNAVPLRNAEGELCGAVGAFVNITERKQAEDALRDADRRKDEFIATLAHELRNPLAPIVNSLELMKRAGGDPAVTEQARATMERQVSQVVRLVDDLLDVSRISRGQLVLRREKLELASVIDQAIEACRPLANNFQHQVHVALPPEPIYLDADSVRLVQVFENLLNNACKYTDPGGNISLFAERQDNEIVVRVKDTGIGIPREKLPAVFEAFIQVHSSLERSRSGLGIGLTMVKRLVEMHRGTVEARSEGPGRGSQFTVRLPILPIGVPHA